MRDNHSSDRFSHAGGVVFRNSGGATAFLLVRSKGVKPEWVFPKGHIELSETAEQAAVREVLEESGVMAKIVDICGTSEFSRGEEKIRVVYFAMVFVSEAKSEEGREKKWATFDEAMELLRFDDSKAILRNARARR